MTTPEPEVPVDYLHLQGDIASTHWWYKARRAWLASLIGEQLGPGATVCDVGTGTGETLETLRVLGADVRVGTELDANALRVAQERFPDLRLVQSFAEQLPLGDAVLDCLTSMDVIEHLDDDVVALREYRRVLRPGAIAVITVPAYQQLWSEFDVKSGHRRRYTRKSLRQALVASGFEVEHVSHLFSFLALPALIVRKTPLGRLVGDSDEVAATGRALNGILGFLATVERRLALGLRRSVPVGLSVIAIARNPDADPEP
jgi:ubiquinone/menaquinone biosynthesis C-methylase UbiE